MSSDMTIAEQMCEELSTEIDRLRAESQEIMEVNRRQHEMILAMCAGKMHPQCPGCAKLRKDLYWVLAINCAAGALIVGALLLR
jgi:hypothetical protein